MKIIRKITIRDVFGKIDIEELLKAEGKALKLVKVLGFCRKAVPGSSSMGDFVKYQGSFAAVNVQTGEEFRSGAMILPGVVQDLLLGALAGDVEEVEFGFIIGIRYDADAIAKYVYEVESLIAPKESDPLEMLAKQLNVAQLAAPAETKAVEEKTDEGKAKK